MFKYFFNVLDFKTAQSKQDPVISFDLVTQVRKINEFVFAQEIKTVIIF